MYKVESNGEKNDEVTEQYGIRVEMVAGQRSRLAGVLGVFSGSALAESSLARG